MDKIGIVSVLFNYFWIFQCLPYPCSLYTSAQASFVGVICQNEIHIDLSDLAV